MKLKNFTDLNAWAVEQWGDTELGDSRRTDRARVLRTRFANAIGAAIAANPQASLPDMMQGWNEIRAAYRLFAQDDVTHSALIQPHITATKQSATQIRSNVVLFIQDTTELDYTHHRQVKHEDALMQLDWYATRWLIEEYHKCLKTGCAVEKRQLESASSLVTLLGFFAVVSVRLLQLRTLSRSNPQLLAHEYVPSMMLKVLFARLGLTNCQLMGEFFLAIARLGGFLGRKGDGLPGWQTLWRGWLRLQDMCWAADLITQSL